MQVFSGDHPQSIIKYDLHGILRPIMTSRFLFLYDDIILMDDHAPDRLGGHGIDLTPDAVFDRMQ